MSPAATLQFHDAGTKSTCCPNCGADSYEHADAKRRIAELESQVRILSDKASAAGEPPIFLRASVGVGVGVGGGGGEVGGRQRTLC